MVLGIGLDVVEVERFGSALERWGERLTAKLFTEEEAAYCMGRRRPEEHMAARFAAKISLFKALGRRLPYRDVEVCSDEGGRPFFRVSGPLIGKDRLLALTITHGGGLAVAETILEEKVA